MSKEGEQDGGGVAGEIKPKREEWYPGDTGPVGGEAAEPGAGRSFPVPVTGHEARITVQALAARKADLDKLGKKLVEEDYKHEAQAILGDAETIGDVLLRKFREQQELPLATPDESRAAIANFLGPVFTRARAKKWDDNDLVLAIAEKTDRLVREATGRAFRAGLAARETSPEVLVVKAVDAVRVQELAEGKE